MACVQSAACGVVSNRSFAGIHDHILGTYVASLLCGFWYGAPCLTWPLKIHRKINEHTQTKPFYYKLLHCLNWILLHYWLLIVSYYVHVFGNAMNGLNMHTFSTLLHMGHFFSPSGDTSICSNISFTKLLLPLWLVRSLHGSSSSSSAPISPFSSSWS